MDLATARRLIQTCVERMRTAYVRPVFDEWAILSLPGKSPGVVAYSGPRAETFLRNLPDDAEPLRARAAGKEFAEGDIEFTPDGTGTRYDAFMKIGPTSYLVLNHSTKTMTEIRADAKWLLAQPALFELTEKFRADPLEA
ncbi:MAG: hypothetical protein ABIZ49_10435 [Opitutaceae bacterium]